MAELNQNAPDVKTKKVRARKLTSRVDLTAMVDLAFLLITFFMLTTSLSKPKSMDLTMPADGPPLPIDQNRSMTILIGHDDQAKCFIGIAGENPVNTVKLGTSELRNELFKANDKALAYTKNPEKGLIVIIKPSNKSNYGNLVDVLDEMAIVGVKSYAIVDLSEKERSLID